MEDHRKHDNNNIKKKKKKKSLPVAIQIGGSFGMGSGVMLFGGALVVATIVSATAIIAFKRRQQHHRSTSTDEHTTDAVPNNKELLMNDDEDISVVDSWPLNLCNSSDEVTSNNAIEAKNIFTLTLDEDHTFGSYDDEQMEHVDSSEDIMFSIVGEDQEKMPLYVDSVFESRRQVDNSYEKIALGCEEQVIMSAPTELRFLSSDDEDSCNEILENSEILINNEKGGQVEAISNEDNKESAKATNIITIEDDVSKNEETVIMNATTEVAFSNEIEVKEERQIDDSDDGDMIPENCEGDLSNKTCLENPILREDHQQTQCNNIQLVIGEGEKAMKAYCVDIEEEIQAREVVEATPSKLMNKGEAKEEVQECVTTKEDESVKKIEIEIPQTQVIKATKAQEKIEMIVDNEIPLIQLIQEEEVRKSNDHKNTNNGTRSIIKQDEYNKSEMWRWSILVLILLLLCVCHWYFKMSGI